MSADAAPERFEPFPVEPLSLPARRELIAAAGGRKALRALLRRRGRDRRALARDILFRASEQLTPVLAVDVEGVRFHLNTADKEISRIVYIFGLYDRPLMHAAFAALRANGGPADFGGKRLLDVGANIGTTTLTAWGWFRAGGSVAIEPDPTNLRFLRMNVAGNGMDDVVRVHAAAATDESRELELELDDYNLGDHRVRTGPPSGGGEAVRVAGVAIDDLVAGGELDPETIGAVWLDVQGHEGRALAGGRRLLEARVPVVMEYWPHGLRDAGDFDLVSQLVSEHYPRIVNLGRPGEGPSTLAGRPSTDLPRVAELYADPDDHTDLLLLPD